MSPVLRSRFYVPGLLVLASWFWLLGPGIVSQAKPVRRDLGIVSQGARAAFNRLAVAKDNIGF